MEESCETLAPAAEPRVSLLSRFLRRALSFEVMLALGLAVITVCTVSTRFNDPDLWWHLKIGEIVWQTHSIPSTDTLSYTAYGGTRMAGGSECLRGIPYRRLYRPDAGLAIRPLILASRISWPHFIESRTEFSRKTRADIPAASL